MHGVQLVTTYYTCTQWPASSAVELMNTAKQEVRKQMLVDALNALLMLINLECKRFQYMKQEQDAWGDDSRLSPLEKELYKSTYGDLSTSNSMTIGKSKCNK